MPNAESVDGIDQPVIGQPAKVKSKGGRPKLSAAEKKRRAALRESNAVVAAYETAIAKLPDEASPASEMSWIRNHPMMGRKDRMEGATKLTKIIVTGKDIKTAPSKAAVHMLQHWVNRPEDFFKGILSEQKKSTKTNADGLIVDDVEDLPEIKAIDELLLSLDCAVQDDMGEQDREASDA